MFCQISNVCKRQCSSSSWQTCSSSGCTSTGNRSLCKKSLQKTWFNLIYLRSIAKQVIPTYINHSRPLIPDGIHLYFLNEVWEEREARSVLICWAPSKEASGTIFISSMVWRGLGSNPRPPAHGANALTTEPPLTENLWKPCFFKSYVNILYTCSYFFLTMYYLHACCQCDTYLLEIKENVNCDHYCHGILADAITVLLCYSLLEFNSCFSYHWCVQVGEWTASGKNPRLILKHMFVNASLWNKYV